MGLFKDKKLLKNISQLKVPIRFSLFSMAIFSKSAIDLYQTNIFLFHPQILLLSSSFFFISSEKNFVLSNTVSFLQHQTKNINK